LQGDRRQLLAAVQAAWRGNVQDRHGEDQLPGQPSDPAEEPLGNPLPALADNVVAVIDGREQGIEMLRSPGRARRGHEQ
jgi:hypothetical protein